MRLLSKQEVKMSFKVSVFEFEQWKVQRNI